MTASCLVCCHFVAQLKMVFQLVLGQSWVEYPMDICCIYYECLLIVVLNSIWVCLRVRCPFLPPKYHFQEQKRTPHFETSLHVDFTNFTRNFVSRLYHFLFFVILMKLFWNFDEQWKKKYCAFHMQLVCCFENVIIRFLQKGMVFGWKLKTKTKLHKNCIQFFFDHQNFNRTSTEMQKFKKKHGKNPKANKRWLYLGKFLYTLYTISVELLVEQTHKNPT